MTLFHSCARMGNPDGGWYDETPPRVVSASPADKGTDVKSGKIVINFNEFIKLENPTEKVVISPPQVEQPEIKVSGKHIFVTLLDSLKENTTYTIDFSDAISDNNEGNPMGNYTYSFSTGKQTDTLEVSGTVLNAEDLEPIKGMLVGLYPEDAVKNPCDSLPPFMRVSRSDSRGHFVIRGIAPGRYTVGALMDMDGDYRFTQRGEMMAFSHEVFAPACYPDHRQDTLWLDDNHIKDILRVPYTHFTPDNLILRAFNHVPTDRYFLKAERTQPDYFTLFYTAPVCRDSLSRFPEWSEDGILPMIKLLNAPQEYLAAHGDSEASLTVKDLFAVEHSALGDTVTYWLRDTMLVNQDTLMVEMTTLLTDTAGCYAVTTDTLEILAKVPYAKRMKTKAREEEEWREKLAKRLKKAKEGEEIDTVMPQPRLAPKYDVKSHMQPDGNIRISFTTPMAKVDTAAVHLYVEQDSLWYEAPFTMRQTDSLETMRNWEVYSDWIPGARYSLEVDSLAFEDIYGLTSDPYKTGVEVSRLDNFASLFVNVTPAYDVPVLVELLNSSGKAVRISEVVNGTAEFYYLDGGQYYLRAIVDRNGNGKWDTGEYYSDMQPEEVYYYPEEIECKAKWDITKAWNLTAVPLDKQKPEKLLKQKADKEKKRVQRNAKRAADKGIPLPQKIEL